MNTCISRLGLVGIVLFGSGCGYTTPGSQVKSDSSFSQASDSPETMNDLLGAVLAFPAVASAPAERPQMGKTPDGQDCEVILAKASDKSSASIFVSIVGHDEGAASNLALQINLYPDVRRNLTITNFENSESSLGFSFRVLNPSQDTDWGWPTPPNRYTQSLQISQNDDQKLTSVTVSEKRTVIGPLFPIASTVTCNL